MKRNLKWSFHIREHFQFSTYLEGRQQTLTSGIQLYLSTKNWKTLFNLFSVLKANLSIHPCLPAFLLIFEKSLWNVFPGTQTGPKYQSPVFPTELSESSPSLYCAILGTPTLVPGYSVILFLTLFISGFFRVLHFNSNGHLKPHNKLIASYDTVLDAKTHSFRHSLHLKIYVWNIIL